MAMRAVNSFRTVSQLCRGNLTVSAVRGASSGPAGQLTAAPRAATARRASALAMLLLVGEFGEQLESVGAVSRRWRFEVDAMLSTTRLSGQPQLASLVSQGDGLALESGDGGWGGWQGLCIL